jgi:hypothetical protein
LTSLVYQTLLQREKWAPQGLWRPNGTHWSTFWV